MLAHVPSLVVAVVVPFFLGLALDRAGSWSKGIILALGAKSPGFKSWMRP